MPKSAQNKTREIISSLSREDKIKFLLAIDEQTRRRKRKTSDYVANEGQSRVHACRKPVRCVFSGNGAGKTALAVNEAIWAAKGFNPELDEYTPVPARVIVVLDHPEKVADKWLPELKKWTNIEDKWCQKRGKPYITRILFPNGSEILFMFHMQEAQLFESIEVDMAIFDEPPPRHVFIALYRGGREKDREARFLIVGTPVTGAWLRIEIKEPWERGEADDVECFTFGTIVNEHNLADGYIDKFKKRLSEKEQRIRLYGEFFDLDGLALSGVFRREIHVIPPIRWNPEWPCTVVIDPHMSKPHHAILLGVDSDNRFHYMKEIKKKCIAREFARELKAWYRGYNIIDIISDSLGSQEQTSGEGFKSFIKVLNEEGVRARSTLWDEKSDEDFIERIQDVLVLPDEPDINGEFIPKLRIWLGNDGIIQDMENVQWLKVKNYDLFKPKLDISNKDFLSCVKYGLASNMHFTKARNNIFRRKTGAETYGIKSAQNKANKVKFRRMIISYNRKRKRPDLNESWEDF